MAKPYLNLLDIMYPENGDAAEYDSIGSFYLDHYSIEQ